MLKLIGAVLLLSGSVGLGVSSVRNLERRVKTLRSMSTALELMKCELDFRAPPMRELFGAAAKGTSEPASSFFYTCAEKTKQMEGRPLAELWRQCMEERLTALTDAEAECLMSVGTVLGRYDVQSQQCVLTQTREQVNGYLNEAVQDRQRKGRMYGALSMAAGIFLVIVML